MSLISVTSSNGLKYHSLRELTAEEETMINSIAELRRSLENVADVVWMLKSAVKAWHESVYEVVKSKDGGRDHFPELNLKTINVLSAFFVLDKYFTSTLGGLLKRGVISAKDSGRWNNAPKAIKVIIDQARSVRGTLHYTLPVKSYRRFSSREETTFSAFLFAHSGRSDSGRGTSDQSVCAVRFMHSLDELTNYASSLWAGLIPIFLAPFDKLCKGLHAEVINAGGEQMTVGHAKVENGELSLSCLDISGSPVEQLLDRLNN